MQERPTGEVTVLLQQMRSGDSEAADKLIPLVVDELRRLARLQLRDERPGHTLQPTALVEQSVLCAWWAVSREIGRIALIS